MSFGNSDMSELAAFGFMINALIDGGSKGDDTNAIFPRADAEDLSNGARYIPDEVTQARRSGKRVRFVTAGGPDSWYWEMPNSSRILHEI